MYTQQNFDNAAAVTPDNSNDLTNPGILYIGGAGNVKVDTMSGQTVTINGITAGTTLRLRVKRVHATGTTATNITVLY
jgi:hypothetical protein